MARCGRLETQKFEHGCLNGLAGRVVHVLERRIPLSSHFSTNFRTSAAITTTDNIADLTATASVLAISTVDTT